MVSASGFVIEDQMCEYHNLREDVLLKECWNSSWL